MNMEKTEFINYLCFKQLIVNYTAEEIINILDETPEPYGLFYDLFTATYDVDEDFFTIDEGIIDKTQTVIGEYRSRDEYRIGNPDYNAMFNDPIIYFNQVKYMAREDKPGFIKDYSAREMKHRMIRVDDIETLINIISLDYGVYMNIINDVDDEFTRKYIGEVTNYFLECYPKIFADKKIYNNTIKLLNNSMSAKAPKSMLYRKKVIKRMNNLNY
ncbi:MAG: hypothetical protein IJI43_04560 [Bacilli bacterium]|nr:hypothetical protein [Bacilli bacterium]